MTSNSQDPADTKAGRYVNENRSVSPVRDTGFRMPPSPPSRKCHIRVQVPHATFLAEYVHNEDIIDRGPAIIRGEKINAVRLITINKAQHDLREARYLDESITARLQRERTTGIK